MSEIRRIEVRRLDYSWKVDERRGLRRRPGRPWPSCAEGDPIAYRNMKDAAFKLRALAHRASREFERWLTRRNRRLSRQKAA